jgi:hypothetical protein
MRHKIADVRQRLGEALRGQFTTEIGRSVERIRNSIAPYSRFVRAEGEKLETSERELAAAAAEITLLRGRIERT